MESSERGDSPCDGKALGYKGNRVLLTSVQGSQDTLPLCPEWPHLKMLSLHLIKKKKSPTNSNGYLLIIILDKSSKVQINQSLHNISPGNRRTKGNQPWGIG